MRSNSPAFPASARPWRWTIFCFGWVLSLAMLPALHAQSIDLSKFSSLRPRCVGPAGMSGRVTAIAGQPGNPDILYVGAASGGLWKSENGGISWRPIFDQQPVQSIGAVAVAPGNPQVVWAGTGEGNPRNSQNSGAGIFRSLDAGRTWQCMGLEKTKAIHRIVVDPRDENVVYAAAMGSAWGPNPDRGVFRTTDGGAHWDKVLHVNDTTGCADLVMDPTNPNKLLAAMWEYHREPWFFTSGGKGSGLYMTLDGGKTWTKQTEKNGLPAGQLGRMGLAFAPSNPSTVYALIEAKVNAFYCSNDGGFTWKKRAEKDIGNRPFYYSEIYVDPENENRIYNLWTAVSMSEDGGRTWSQIADFNAVHPDHHAFFINPLNPKVLIDGNDGGLTISRDRGRTWSVVDNLPLGQFYHVEFDDDVPYNVMGGMQDNGSYVGPSSVWAEGGIRNHYWREVMFGDGFDVLPKRGERGTVYAMSQSGYLRRINRFSGESVDIRPVHPQDVFLRFNWNAGLALDPFNNNGLYFGSQFLHHSTDAGRSWEIISPDLTTNDTTKQKQKKSGGLTMDATAAENFTTIIAISPSPLEAGLVWVGTDDGNLQVTQDGGKTWKNVADRLPGAPKGAWIAQIEIGKHHPGEAFVVLNDYRRNNWEPYVYHTRDHGNSWRRLVDEESVPGHCLSIVQDPVEEKLMFLGTDRGLYFTVDAGANWTKWDREFPSVPVNEMKIHPQTHDLIVGTFGRAIWIFDDIRPLRTLATQGKALWDKDMFLLPVLDHIAAEFHSMDGYRYTGANDFIGENLNRGARIQLYLRMPGLPPATKPDSKEADATKSDKEGDKKGKKSDADDPNAAIAPVGVARTAATGEANAKNMVKIHLLTLAGDSLRTFVVRADTGFFSFRWDLNRDGFYPAKYQKFPRPGDVPGGPLVGPGTYRLVASHQKVKDSVTVRILPDPRHPAPDPVALQAREAKIKRFLEVARAGTSAFERVRDARDMLDRFEKAAEGLPDTRRDSIKNAAKAVRDTMRSLMEIYLDPEEQKGLEHLTVQLSERIDNVGAMLDPIHSGTGGNEDLAISLLEADVRRTLTRINHFLEVQWPNFRQKMEAIKVPLFNDIQPVKLE
ncbi:MAG: hypothetical protein U0176_21655 [Bacteroidia bacterium]